MSSGNRSKLDPHLGWFGVTIAALFCALIIGVVAYSTGRQSEQQHQQAIAADQATNGRTESAQQYLRDHAGVPAIAERLISNPEPAGESEKDQRDLAAQENTAAWTFWIVVFSAGQLVLSAGGLVALLVTIRQGRKALRRARTANRISEDTAKRELRAYIVASPGGILMKDGEPPKAIVKIKNVGQTPAQKVCSDLTITLLPKDAVVSALEDTPDPENRDMSVGPGSDHQFVYSPEYCLTPTTVTDLADGEMSFLFHGHVAYSDVFGARRMTYFAHLYRNGQYKANEGTYLRVGNGST